MSRSTAPVRTRTPNGTPVWISGEGPALVLAHGVLMDHRMWSRQVGALSDRYRVCRFDMLGHGSAPDPPGERRLEDFVDQLHEVVETVRGEGRPVLAGFSMGGLIAQAYAVRRHAGLGGLVLLNAVYDRTPEEARRVLERFEGNLAGGVEHAVESARRRWFREGDPDDLVEEILGWMRDGDFAAKCKAHRVFATSGGDLVGRLGRISCPALVMTGELDSGSTPLMARKMAEQIPGARLEIVAGQHHMMPVLAAGRANTIIAGFLGECLGA